MALLRRVPNREMPDTSIVHAVICVVEARYHLDRQRAPSPKQLWRLSLQNLLEKVRALSGRSEGFSMDHMVLALARQEGSSAVKPDTGVGLYADYEGRKANVGQIGIRFSISRIDTYELASKRHNELVWEEMSTGRLMRFEDVAEELRANGPLVARFYMDSKFKTWSRESAVNCNYQGPPFVERSDVGRKKQAGKPQHVAVIGFASPAEGERHFIAQNSYGEDWGDDGHFRLLPKCVSHISIPILR